MGLTDVYAAIIPDLPFEPAVHVFYGETVLRIHDGIVKQQDVPAEMGGSGVELPEQGDANGLTGRLNSPKTQRNTA